MISKGKTANENSESLISETIHADNSLTRKAIKEILSNSNIQKKKMRPHPLPKEYSLPYVIVTKIKNMCSTCIKPGLIPMCERVIDTASLVPQKELSYLQLAEIRLFYCQSLNKYL
ncbi:hypothetical protein MXB_2268 [Myxobolus squamalis]|nr:hypothetical protein MXB_2268 [Myxobolus squamalis]